MSLPESKPIIAVANQTQENVLHSPAPDLNQLTDALIAFRDERDWRQFHSLKNLMISLNLEVSELLELTQWKDDAEVESAVSEPEFRQRFEEECADIFLYLLLIAERAGIDLTRAAARKIEHNAAKYPVEKSRGNARKYTEL
ncbi:MAG: nucleotide pyrophosphohydrolase [Hyphomicrobiales bacterium]|nr:MAG: nucleotide pyrophosphohydrolase [Hyphomicrobiales bacterium]